MKITTCITCVDYADFLRLTLPFTISQFDDVMVLTSPSDIKTMRLCQRLNVPYLCTNAWTHGGATFNKARAINEWMEFKSRNGTIQWFLTLDADVLLPKDLEHSLKNLDARALYSLKRRICNNQLDWNQFANGHRPWFSFELNVPPVRNGLVWGKRPTSNPAGVCGYFLLFNTAFSFGAKKFPESPTANNYDVDFALSFPDHLRFFVDGIDVLHLGPTKTNWSGRVSERWNDAVLLPREMYKLHFINSINL